MENSKTREDYTGFIFVTTGEDGRFYILSVDENQKIYLQPKSGAPDLTKTLTFWSDDPVQVNKLLKELSAITGSTIPVNTEDLLPVKVLVSHARQTIEIL